MGEGYDSEKYDLCEGCFKGMIKSIPSQADRWKEEEELEKHNQEEHTD
jgi:hypothetical protein